MLKSKLLHHFSSVDETVAILLKMIPLSHSTQQQLAVMEPSPPGKPIPGPVKSLRPKTRRIRIHHELVMFPIETGRSSSYKTIPPGDYEIEETLRGTHRWLKLAAEGWGNAEICWDCSSGSSVRQITPEQKRNFFEPVARMHQAISNAIIGRPHFQAQAQANQLLKEAGFFIKRGRLGAGASAAPKSIGSATLIPTKSPTL